MLLIDWCYLILSFRIFHEHVHCMGSHEQKDLKVTVRFKRVLIVTEYFNFAVNHSDAKKSARYNRTSCQEDPLYKNNRTDMRIH